MLKSLSSVMVMNEKGSVANESIQLLVQLFLLSFRQFPFERVFHCLVSFGILKVDRYLGIL